MAFEFWLWHGVIFPRLQHPSHIVVAEPPLGCPGCCLMSVGSNISPMPAQQLSPQLRVEPPDASVAAVAHTSIAARVLAYPQPPCGAVSPTSWLECYGAAHGRTLLPRAGLPGLERWAASRARHWPHGSRPEPGHAEGTRQALELSAGTTVVCLAAGCGALVDLRTARRAACAAARSSFRAGDGCSGHVCSKDHRRLRFRRRQAEMARAIASGKRVLVAWPERAAGRVKLWAEPMALSMLVASTVLERAPMVSSR